MSEKKYDYEGYHEFKKGEMLKICGMFSDQQGIIEVGKITGWNANGVPARKFKWIDPKVSELKGKPFEAFEDQIENSMNRCNQN